VENGRDFSDTTNLIALADKEGFVVVFPEGKGTLARFWNAGQCCGSAARGGVPDIAFLDQLVDELSPAVCGGRVLGTGFSNGGMMVHRWACQGRTLDGAVPVSGPLEASLQNCDGPPMPILHIHGAADPLVPWQGGQGNGITDHRYRSVEETMGVWRERNRCTDAEPQLVLGNGVSCTNWECEAPTSMCLIDGWGHAWPGGRNGAAALDAGVEGYAWFDLSVAP
jgi:polyhydroxybutyrate depolymerase